MRASWPPTRVNDFPPNILPWKRSIYTPSTSAPHSTLGSSPLLFHPLVVAGLRSRSSSSSLMAGNANEVILGGAGGTKWDDGVYSGVREIIVNHGWCIDAIQAVYDKAGTQVTGNKHGGTGGDKATVTLDYPNEQLKGVSGCFGMYENKLVIRSLKFETSYGTRGPFGRENGTLFTFSLDNSQIVGFQGRSSDYVDAIGFHVPS